MDSKICLKWNRNFSHLLVCWFSGQFFSSTWWLHNPLESPHHLNLASSRISTRGSSFGSFLWASLEWFTSLSRSFTSWGRPLSLNSIKFKEDWEIWYSCVFRNGENRLQWTASSLCHNPQGAPVFYIAVLFLYKLPQMNCDGFNSPFDTYILHIFILVLYIRMNSNPIYPWYLGHLYINALLSLQTHK